MSWPGSSSFEASSAETPYLTLGDILGRSVAIEWYEGVALVRAVIDRLTSLPNIPELNQVRLRPTGDVDVVGVGSVDEPVRRLGQLLQALIAQADSPVQLRLMITQATAPQPLFASVQELTDGLAYFERPDRQGVLRRLYERAASAQPMPNSIAQLTLDSVAPLPHDSPLRPKTPKPVAGKRVPAWQVVAGLAVVVVVAAAIGFGYARLHGASASSRSKVTQLTDRASGTLGSAVMNGMSAVTETLGMGRLVPANAPPGPAPAPPAPESTSEAKPVAKKPARSNQRIVDTHGMPGAAFDLPPAPTTGIADSDTTYDVVVKDGSDDHASDGLITYGPESAGVMPPIALEPPLPHELPPDLRREDLGRIELIVAVDGSVESVRLVGKARSVHDAMFLSVAKAWQFQPALKNGAPVRYRKTIWINTR
jgi:hypothetical protein